MMITIDDINIYTSRKATRLEWLGDIPGHWEIMRLKNISSLKARIGFHGLNTTHFIERGAFCITGTDFIDGRIDLSNCYKVSEFWYDLDKNIQIRNGDLLVTKDGTIGKIALVDNLTAKDKATLNSGVFVLRTQMLPRYLFWQLNSNLFRTQIDLISKGSTINHLYERDFKNFIFVQPLLSEQTAIARVLDNKTALIDKAIALKEKQIALLKEYRQAVIQQAVTKGLNSDVKLKDSGVEWIGEIPAHWKVKKLKYVSTVQSGITLGKSYSERKLVEMPYLRVANVQSGFFLLDDIAYLKLPNKEISRYLVKSGDILVTEGGDLDKLGRGAVWRNQIENCLHQNHVFAIRIKEDGLDPEYVSTLMEADYGRRYFTNTANKTTNLASTNSTKLGNFPLVVPPRHERDSIMAFLEKKSVKINTAVSLKQQEIGKLKEYKASLINSTVTGRIKVT